MDFVINKNVNIEIYGLFIDIISSIKYYLKQRQYQIIITKFLSL